MVFPASDVLSLPQSLHRWEIAEYISEAFVIIACAGEMVADLGEHWLGERWKKRVERHSTMLLVAALSVSLICLVRTNELSGVVIGSLGHEAEEADNKAKTAISDSSTALGQAKDALTKAGKAQESLGRAESEAKNAETAASNALSLSRDARGEADWAKDLAAKAEAQLADRTLTDEQVKSFANELRPFAGQEYEVVAYWDSKESVGIANKVHQGLQTAHWTYLPLKDWHGLFGGIVGIQVWIHPEADERVKRAATALVDALTTAGLEAVLKLQNPANNPKHNKISLSVGSKR